MPSPLREALEDQVTERQMYAELAAAARIGGWLCIHHHDSRHSAAGFPDIIAIRGGELLALECKRTKGKTTPAQETWLAAFREFSAAHGLENYVEAAVVRPGGVHAVLERLASRPGLPVEVA